MPYKGGVQLLPETARRPTLTSYTSGNSYFYTGVAIGIGVIIIGAILGSYKANLKDTIDGIDAQLQATENSRDKAQEQVLVDASKQSKLMRQLLTSKIYWSQALTAMERMTQSSVRMTQIDASAAKGLIDFHATADSYATVARQMAAFVAGTGVKDVTLKSVKATSQGGVELDGQLVIDTKVLLNKTPAK